MEDALLARRALCPLAIFPVGHAAAIERIGPCTGAHAQYRIEYPFFFTGLGLEGEDALKGRAVVERVVHHDRRGLEGRQACLAAAVGVVAAVVHPRHFQPVDVVAVDLGEG